MLTEGDPSSRPKEGEPLELTPLERAAIEVHRRAEAVERAQQEFLVALGCWRRLAADSEAESDVHLTQLHYVG